jgi:hypothetical protein
MYHLAGARLPLCRAGLATWPFCVARHCVWYQRLRRLIHFQLLRLLRCWEEVISRPCAVPWSHMMLLSLVPMAWKRLMKKMNVWQNVGFLEKGMTIFLL